MNAIRHRNYIPRDGYTEQAYIEAVPRLHDAPLRFSYRPLLPEERAEHLDAIENMSGVKNQLACSKFIAGRLVSWNLADDNGETLAITPVMVGRLKPALANKLYTIILGVTPSDIDPEWPEDAKAEEAGGEYESAKFGAPPGISKLEESVKN